MVEETKSWLSKAKDFIADNVKWLLAGIGAIFAIIFLSSGDEEEHHPDKLDIDFDPDADTTNNHDNITPIDSTLPELPTSDFESGLTSDDREKLDNLSNKAKRKAGR